MGSSNENSAFGPVKNPWDVTRVSGGSSGGSAAAVAAGIVPDALGSDTGGSVRQPASLCGVLGLKPTYGRNSRYGLVAFASSLDQVGVFAREVADVARVLGVIAGRDSHDATTADTPVPDYLESLTGDLKGLRVGFPTALFGKGLDDEVGKSVKAVVDVYRKLGAEIVDIELPHAGYAIVTSSLRPKLRRTWHALMVCATAFVRKKHPSCDRCIGKLARKGSVQRLRDESCWGPTCFPRVTTTLITERPSRYEPSSRTTS